jgi:hypothetical protein
MAAPTPAAESPIQGLLNFLQAEPALVTSLLAAAAALLAAYSAHVSQAQDAAIVTIGTAAMALLTAALARPISVPIITGSIITGLTAAAAWGLKLSPELLSLLSAALGMTLTALLWRLHLTPNVSVRRGAATR